MTEINGWKLTAAELPCETGTERGYEGVLCDLAEVAQTLDFNTVAPWDAIAAHESAVMRELSLARKRVNGLL